MLRRPDTRSLRRSFLRLRNGSEVLLSPSAQDVRNRVAAGCPVGQGLGTQTLPACRNSSVPTELLSPAATRLSGDGDDHHRSPVEFDLGLEFRWRCTDPELERCRTSIFVGGGERCGSLRVDHEGEPGARHADAGHLNRLLEIGFLATADDLSAVERFHVKGRPLLRGAGATIVVVVGGVAATAVVRRVHHDGRDRLILRAAPMGGATDHEQNDNCHGVQKQTDESHPSSLADIGVHLGSPLPLH